MNEAQLVSVYLDLFLKNWDDPSLVPDLQSLRVEAAQAGLERWTQIIDARIARTEKRFEDGLTLLDSVIRDDAGNVHAILLKGLILSYMPERAAEGLELLANLVTALDSATDTMSQQVLALAMLNKGAALATLDRPSDALVAFEGVIERFGAAPELLFRMEVALAMVNKGVTLGQMERLSEELSAYEAVIECFRAAAELPLREEVAKAMVYKGMTLAQMERRPEVLAAYDAVIERFRDASEPVLKQWWDRAQRFKAVLLAPRGGREAEEAKETAIAATEGKYSENLRVYLELALAHFERKRLDYYLERIRDAENQTKEFLSEESRFAPDASFLLILREWNSYTPALPAEGEADRGGGYFIRHAGEGIVIDPGYDFIENFYRAGGQLCDIDHICITHAHDDHTAELEALLMLLHRYNREPGRSSPKCVNVYLSQACHRKFTGLIPLRDDLRFDRIVTLCRPSGPDCLHRIQLTDHVTLTVLPAYHDDALTRETAVGLDFRFRLADGTFRRVVFTGDTGYYPRLLKADGTEDYYDTERRRPKVDTREGNGIDAQYPKEKEQAPPDLLVAHIGSIQEEEFKPLEAIKLGEREEGEWYYANHLGMLGMLTLLDKIGPRSAIVSEFGAEMRGFHIEVVNTIAEALRDKQSRTPAGPQTAVFPGDLTMVYYIAEDKFLCHEDSRPHAANELTCHPTAEWKVQSVSEGGVPISIYDSQQKRAHLCLHEPKRSPNEWGIREYYEKRYLGTLPHFKVAAEPMPPSDPT